MDQRKDPNQGEGDRNSARRYDKHVEEFVEDGRVPQAAHEAKEYVERAPREAARAERDARRGPHARYRATLDELVAKGRSIFERVRARLARK